MLNPPDYHLAELKIALDPSRPGHLIPDAVPPGKRVLDVGCGAGQTLIAVYPDRLTFGVDPDLEALQLGHRLSGNLALACSSAEALPFPNGSFDSVIARVSLPYTNLRLSLREIHRVLKPGGALWAVLHSVSTPWRSALGVNLKRWVFFVYIALNSLLFHFAERMVPYLNGRYESFQTIGGMRRALRRVGFREISIVKDKHFVATAIR